MAARRTVSRSSRPARRKTIWARQSNSGAAIAAGADQFFNADLLAPLRTQMGVTAIPGITIIRVRLMWTIVNTTAQSRFVLAGIRRFTNSPDASQDELAVVDGPANDPHADWMMFDGMLLQVFDSTMAIGQREVDVKSMRKLDEASDSLVLSFQAVDELAAQVRYVASVLVALP